MKLGFLTRAIPDIEKASRLGFDGVELYANAFGDPLAGALDQDPIGAARRLSEAHGVEITSPGLLGGVPQLT